MALWLKREKHKEFDFGHLSRWPRCGLGLGLGPSVVSWSQREKHREFDFGIRSRWPRRCPVVPQREKQLEQNQLEQKQPEQKQLEQTQIEQKTARTTQQEQKKHPFWGPIAGIIIAVSQIGNYEY